MTWVSPLWPHSVGSILHSALWGQGDSKPAWLPTAAVRVQIGPLHCCTWTAWLNVFKKGNPKEFRLGQCPKVWLFLSDTVLLRTSPLINFYVDSTRRRVKDPFVNQLAARLYSTTGCNLVWSLATCFSVTGRSRSGGSESLTESELADLTDVTLVSDDTYGVETWLMLL